MSMNEQKQHTYRCSPDIHLHAHSDSFTLTDDEEDRDEFCNSCTGNTIRSSTVMPPATDADASNSTP